MSTTVNRPLDFFSLDFYLLVLSALILIFLLFFRIPTPPCLPPLSRLAQKLYFRGVKVPSGSVGVVGEVLLGGSNDVEIMADLGRREIRIDGEVVGGGVRGMEGDREGMIWVERVVGNERGVVVGGERVVLGCKRSVEDLIGVAKVFGMDGEGNIEARRLVGGSLSIFATTFNMGDADPGGVGDVEVWLNTHADIVMVGVQEMKWSGAEAWRSLLDQVFIQGRGYICIGHTVAWDRALTCYAKGSLAGLVGMRAIDTENVGIAGVGGNKGAIGMRFAVGDTVFAVVNSHLAAHQNAVDKRNEDYIEIAKKLRLADYDDTELLGSVIHYLFWLGDLNYRIDLPRDKVLEMIAAGDYSTLLLQDQLRKTISAGSAFPGFLEGQLHFNPTYRYDRGIRTYSVDRLRVPAWCDRVLYRGLPGTNVSVLNYYAADEITTSDHSPVVAEFFVTTQDSPAPRSEILANVSVPRAKLAFSKLRISLSEVIEKSEQPSPPPPPDSSNSSVPGTSAIREAVEEDQFMVQFRGAVLLDNLHETSFTASSNNVILFEGNKVPSLPLVVSDCECVRKRHIVVTLKRGRAERVESVGTAVLWLGEKVGADEQIMTRGKLVSGGLEIGDVHASFAILVEKWKTLSGKM